MAGYAVVDLETTGFSYAKGDRIVEIGVVLVNEAGEIESQWETLVNPRRHVGATHVHKIEAADVVMAPTFDDVADCLVELLAGRILVAHNAAFDERFIRDSLRSSGRYVGDQIPTIDTAGLVRRYARIPRVRLEDCCEYFGIVNSEAHSALADAIATAQILQILLSDPVAHRDPCWSDGLAWASRHDGYTCHAHGTQPKILTRAEARLVREAISSGSWFVAASQCREKPTEQDVSDYFDLLDAVFLDRRISIHEQQSLLGFLTERNLSSESIAELHRTYLRSIVKAAYADGVLTERERELIDVVARHLKLDVDDSWIEADCDTLNPQPDVNVNLGCIRLCAGDRVTVTGPVLYSNEYWQRYFDPHGVEVAGLSKKTRVLIAGDPDSQSGKAKKARDYNIPIIGEDAVDTVIVFE